MNTVSAASATSKNERQVKAEDTALTDLSIVCLLLGPPFDLIGSQRPQSSGPDGTGTSKST